MEEILVSIIVPVYNTEKYLQRCIDSLLAQSYHNIEIILVNDGSTDNSMKVIHDAADSDGRIKVISQAKKGPSAARNNGMALASGEYLMFCDSDDTVDSQWVEKMLDAAKKHPDSLVVCGYNKVFCSSDKELITEKEVVQGGVYPKEEYFSLIAPGVTGSACTKIYKQSLVLGRHMVFDEGISHAEDAVFNINYLEMVSSFFVIDEPLYNIFYFNRETRATLSSEVTYTQMQSIYLMRLPYICEKYLLSRVEGRLTTLEFYKGLVQ